jgi:hypothetical protein
VGSGRKNPHPFSQEVKLLKKSLLIGFADGNVFSVQDYRIALNELNFAEVDYVGPVYPQESGSFKFFLDGLHGGIHDIAGVFGVYQNIIGQCLHK